MKKKLFLLSALLSFSTLAFSQTTVRSDINNTINNLFIPILGISLVIVTILSVLHNADGIRGKAGADQKEAWFNVGQTVVFIMVGISVILYIAERATSITFSI